MQLNRVNNKECWHSHSWSPVWGYMYAPGFHVLLIGDMFVSLVEMVFLASIVFAWEHIFKYSPFLPSLLPLIQCDKCMSSLSVCGLIARFQDFPPMGVVSIWQLAANTWKLLDVSGSQPLIQLLIKFN